jgi:hypothetical protein
LRHTALVLTGTISLIALLAGCSSEAQLPASVSAESVAPASTEQLDELYVSDFGTGRVEMLRNGTYKKVGAIARGLNGPDGNFVDTHGNFYVANWAGRDIAEYAPGSSSPSHTYSAGMTDPVNVSVDSAGSVYEADFNGAFVNEYAQGRNNVIASCAPGAQVSGVAVDKLGDVFVAYGANIAEYKSGLDGCNQKALKVSLGFAGGMVFDKNDNIIVCDQLGPTVDVIAPPYSAVTRTIGSGFTEPLNVTLDKENRLAFVADDAAKTVTVIDYASGKNVVRLGRADGLLQPSAAVDRPNADY